MEKLSTIQKRENLNTIYRDNEPGPGGAYHNYVVSFGPDYPETDDDGVLVWFQEGPRKDPEARRGVLDSDLLEIVRDRLRSFQDGEFSCRENACALTHIEEALMWLNCRVEDRIERGALGTMKK